MTTSKAPADKAFRLAIQGSRTLGDERVTIIILEEAAKHGATAIITSGEPDGVCAVARAVAPTLGVPLILHFLNFRYLRGAFEHRSVEIQRNCDHVCFIHDGSSKGTANEVRLAEKLHVPFSYYTLAPSEHKVSVGFGTDYDEKAIQDAIEQG